jgi:hypothetical protein
MEGCSAQEHSKSSNVTQESHVPGAEAIIGPDGVLSSVGTIIIGD